MQSPALGRPETRLASAGRLYPRPRAQNQRSAVSACVYEIGKFPPNAAGNFGEQSGFAGKLVEIPGVRSRGLNL